MPKISYFWHNYFWHDDLFWSSVLPPHDWLPLIVKRQSRNLISTRMHITTDKIYQYVDQVLYHSTNWLKTQCKLCKVCPYIFNFIRKRKEVPWILFRSVGLISSSWIDFIGLCRLYAIVFFDNSVSFNGLFLVWQFLLVDLNYVHNGTQ